MAKPFGHETAAKSNRLGCCFPGAQLHPGDAAFDTEAVQRAVDFVNTMVLVDQSAPVPGTEGVTTDRDGMNMWGPWASWYIMRDVEFDWDVVPIPMGTEEVVLAWGSTLAAIESSEHQDEVRQSMDFFLSPDTQFQRGADCCKRLIHR